MSNYAISLKRTSLLLAAMSFTALLLVVNLASFFGKADAAQLTNRSLTLSSTLPGTETGDLVGGSATNGSDATWTFAFTRPTAATDVITFVVCDDPISATCTMPAGLDVTGAANGTTGEAGVVAEVAGGDTNDFTFNATTPGTGAVTIVVDNIVNPNEIDAFFVRITTDQGDDGVVASAITEGIEITARVKETLGFSTGAIIAAGVGNPSTTCDPITTTGAIQLGDPTENALDISTSYINYSAFRLYTNAANGVVVTYEGELPTLGGGVYNPANDMLDAIGATSTASAAGTEQFGLAVDGSIGGNGAAQTTTVNSIAGGAGNVSTQYVNDDTVFDITQTPAPGILNITANYDDGENDNYSFVDSQANVNAPVQIATSDSYVDCVTVPVKYVANIAPLTPAGTYTTTIVYTAVPTY